MSIVLVWLVLLGLLGQPFQLVNVEAAGPTNPTALDNIPLCGVPAHGMARCHAIKHNKNDVAINATTGIAGYDPQDLQAAYKLTSASATRGAGITVAVVDAYDNPNAATDLAIYRSKFGLPALSPCPSNSGPCFKKVNQFGEEGNYPAPNAGWAGEIALDIDMVSAICPNCNILLVEAISADLEHLGTGVDTAVRLGANAISNSYGAGEWNPVGNNPAFDAHWKHSGVAITASTGDSGYGVQFPAVSSNLIAVGGTNLTRSTNIRQWTESAWSGAGSGCSAYTAKPSWQKDKSCTRRTVADVSAVADPNNGVATYNTYSSSGWQVLGGTSVSAPIIASVFALAGNTGIINNASYLYANNTSTNFWDVTGGKNGNCGTRNSLYLCSGMSGYDGPTGLGTPNGIGGF